MIKEHSWRISKAKARWHNYVCEIAQNRIAHNMLSRLTLRTAQLRNQSVVRKERQKQSVLELQTLMDAIKNRDVDTAAEAARRHVINASASALMGSKAGHAGKWLVQAFL